MTIREWLAQWGWSGASAETMLRASTALAGLSLDDVVPAGAVGPSGVPTWVRRCGFCCHRVRVCDASFQLNSGQLCPGRQR